MAKLAAARSWGSSSQGMAAAAALVAGSLIASRVLGLVRISIFADLFGTSRAMADYNAAFRIPDILFTVVAGGALSSAFVPVFAGLLERNREQDAWRVANTVLNSLLLALVVLAAGAFVLAPQLTHLLYPGKAIDPVQTASLTRIMLVQPILLGLGGLFAAMQNSYNRFLLPAIAPVLYNLAIIVGAALFGPHFGVTAAAWAVVVGAVIMFEVQIWGVSAELGLYRAVLNWRIPDSRQVLKLMGPRLLGLSAFQLMLIVTYLLASGLTEAGYNSITYAWSLIMFPVGAVGTSVGMAVFPSLSRQSAGAHDELVARTVRQSLRAIVFLTLPATAGLIVLRRPIIQLLFAHGAWTTGSTTATALALEFYAGCIVPLATIEVVARAFYALKNTRTPVTIAIIAAGLDAVLCTAFVHLLPRSEGQGGLGLATAIAVWVQIGLLLVALRKRMPAVTDTDFRKSATAMIVATAIMSGCVYAGLRLLESVWAGSQWFHALLECVVGIGIGLVVYVGVARILNVPEVERVTSLINRLSPARTDQRTHRGE
ncbi:MAG TPA: murein biosynthesis integral membrane protein MurJ [Chloroflexota bacterium]|jgi:putative peptidoglycan lipid II flippase|nr:murein biosynthesis integral membrane protein MurJ [Chloroflexota bacterium]